MLSTLVLLAIVAGSFPYTDAAKCDNAVIEKIKALGGPTGILKKLTTFGTMSIYKSSSDFFVPDIECTSVKFYKEKKTFKEFLHIALKEEGKNRDNTQELEESDGTISNKGKYFMMYTVYSANNVFACYTCTSWGEAGPLEGYVAVKEHDYNQDDVTAAVAALESVGVSATKTHPDTCP